MASYVKYTLRSNFLSFLNLWFSTKIFLREYLHHVCQVYLTFSPYIWCLEWFPIRKFNRYEFCLLYWRSIIAYLLIWVEWLPCIWKFMKIQFGWLAYMVITVSSYLFQVSLTLSIYFYFNFGDYILMSFWFDLCSRASTYSTWNCFVL
jgi:hypothetical protein